MSSEAIQKVTSRYNLLRGSFPIYLYNFKVNTPHIIIATSRLYSIKAFVQIHGVEIDKLVIGGDFWRWRSLEELMEVHGLETYMLYIQSLFELHKKRERSGGILPYFGKKEASNKSDISCKRAKCVCHFHWRQWNIMMSYPVADLRGGGGGV